MTKTISVPVELLERLVCSRSDRTRRIARYDLRALLAQPTEQPWKDLAAIMYQATGAFDMPSRVLDALSAAANGGPFAHMLDGILPCVPAEQPSAANQYPLPDDLYPGSKDWQAADYAGRVEWLHAMYESAKREIERLENSLIAKQEQPSAAKVPEYALRSRIADLLHLLQFAKIETPTPTDAEQAEIAMNDIEAMLAASPQPAAEQGEATPAPTP